MASASLQGLLSSRPCVARAAPRFVPLASAMPSRVNVQPPTKESQRQGTHSHALAAAAAAAGLAVADVTRGLPSTSADVLPSGTAMANFLLGYRRVLEQAAASGDCLRAAAEGTDILCCVRDWLLRHHGHVQHGNERCPRAQRHKLECAVEACLWDLESDISRIMTNHHSAARGSENMSMQQHIELQRMLLQLARLHCTEAASLLRSL